MNISANSCLNLRWLRLPGRRGPPPQMVRLKILQTSNQEHVRKPTLTAMGIEAARCEIEEYCEQRAEERWFLRR